MAGRADRDQQSNKTGDRAQSAMGGGGKTTEGGGGGALRSYINKQFNDPEGLRRDIEDGSAKPKLKAAAEASGPTERSGGSTGATSVGGAFSMGPLGGTTTQETYTPGAVQNFPDAESPLTNLVEGAMLSPTGPVGIAGAVARSVYTGVTDDADPFSDGKQTSPFSNTGPQRGFQPDRYRGEASLGGLGGDGGAVNSGDDEREIAGQRFGAGTMALTGDSETPIDGGDGSGEYSDDIMLRDRRKPKVGAGTQMLLG
jgi:hypothetical protein